MEPAGLRSGFVAVAGRPNVGKSTLVNALCGGKVAIVSDKPQTTRRRIFGIANGDDYQLVLADLPGFQRPRDPLTEHMQRTVDASFEDVEGVLFVLDARERIGAGDRFIAAKVFALGVPVVIALNKVDRLKPGHIAQQMQTGAQLGDFHALHPVSAKTGDGVGELRDELVGLLPEGPRYFPVDQRTDLSARGAGGGARPREGAAPHARGGAARAHRRGRGARREGRAGDDLRRDGVAEADPGRQGRAMVREIGTRARPEVEALLGHPVFLELHVKVQAAVAPGRAVARAAGALVPEPIPTASSAPSACSRCGRASACSSLAAAPALPSTPCARSSDTAPSQPSTVRTRRSTRRFAATRSRRGGPCVVRGRGRPRAPVRGRGVRHGVRGPGQPLLDPLTPTPELEEVERVLRPGGSLRLFNDSSAPEKGEAIAARVAEALYGRQRSTRVRVDRAPVLCVSLDPPLNSG